MTPSPRNSQRKIVFISHDSDRGGATILLLEFLRWLRANTSISFDVIARRGGELEADFRKVANVFILDQIGRGKKRGGIVGRVATRVATTIGGSDAGELESFVDRLAQEDVGVIYSNT